MKFQRNYIFIILILHTHQRERQRGENNYSSIPQNFPRVVYNWKSTEVGFELSSVCILQTILFLQNNFVLTASNKPDGRRNNHQILLTTDIITISYQFSSK